MRISSTFISGAVAAVAVAGSANAGIAPNVVDPFTTTQAFGNDSSTGFVSITGGLFNERNATRTLWAGGTGVSQSNNNVAFTTNRDGIGAVILSYRMAGGSSNDLSLLTGMSIALSALNLNVSGGTGTAATGLSFSWLVTDVNSKQMYADQNLFSNGTSTFDFAAATKDLGFDLTKVHRGPRPGRARAPRRGWPGRRPPSPLTALRWHPRRPSGRCPHSSPP
jgi:hypothetical protein